MRYHYYKIWRRFGDGPKASFFAYTILYALPTEAALTRCLQCTPLARGLVAYICSAKRPGQTLAPTTKDDLAFRAATLPPYKQHITVSSQHAGKSCSVVVEYILPLFGGHIL